MKKILIIADGILAKQFLEKIMSLKGSENLYTILAYRDKTLPKDIMKKYDLHFFDPTSFSKLSDLLYSGKFYQIMITMSKRHDLINTYKNIRRIDKDVEISLIDRWGIKDFKDAKLSTLISKNLLVSRFADFLPDRPVVARNVGLGEGEVMEVQVPAGSSYLYRHLASIEQKEWRIVALYRNKKLLLSRPTLMIRPNDTLLLVGKPSILANVYKSIKQESGQFPKPFGSNIYTLIDMQKMSDKQIDFILNDAMLLHSNLNNQKLYVRVVNPTYSKAYEKIKKYRNTHIIIDIEYHRIDIKKILQDDIDKLDIGLILADKSFFKSYKEILYKQKLPVLKVGIFGYKSVEKGVILATNSEDIERESSVILDVCSQLDLKINLYNFDPSDMDESKNLVDHFEHLSQLFEIEVNIIENDEKNPLLELKDKKDFIQFVPFNQKIIKSRISTLMSTDMDKLYYKLEDNYQLFIPAEE
ncbi:MAG: potassium transporter TrkA [Proteobacteria bacterium]|nr:MAG: potassium transporter TrkA [Pseudomonadota bacterium]